MKRFIDTEFTTVTEVEQETRVPSLGGYETNDDVQYSVMDRGDGTCLVRVTAPSATMSEIESASETTVMTEQEASESLSSNRERANLENLDQPDIEVDQILNKYTVEDLLTEEDKQVANIVLNWSSLPRGAKQNILDNYNTNTPQDLIEDVPDSTLASIVDSRPEFDGIPDHIQPATAARIATQRATAGNQVLQDQELTALDKAAVAEGCPSCEEIPSSSRGERQQDMGSLALDVVRGSEEAHDKMLEYVKGNTDVAPWKDSSA